MSDYISRKAAVKIAQKYGLANGSALGRHTGLADCIATEIEGLPAANVEPVRFLKLQDDKRTASHAIGKVIDHVDKTPTVDAVPVVRCRECRYYAVSGATTSFCIHPGGKKFTSDSDYCSRGQRRDQSADVRNMEEGNKHE